MERHKKMNNEILEQVYKTVEEMMTEGRKYEYVAVFVSKFNGNTVKFYRKKNNDKKKEEITAIMFITENKLGINEFKKHKEFLQNTIHDFFGSATNQNNNNNAIDHLIMFTKDYFSTNIAQECESVKLPSFAAAVAVRRISNYLYKYYTHNVTKHKLYHPHVMLSEEETKHFFAKYKASVAQLPKLHTTDRICEFFDFQIGTIVRIEKYYGSGNHCAQYRIVDVKQ